ncbi:hypothetical protein BC828DRAFT_139526 [Blastocladiella britannica]|nr:hypothetical protein BC828DRAFT_139526 [Blastocladiella britannica]
MTTSRSASPARAATAARADAGVSAKPAATEVATNTATVNHGTASAQTAAVTTASVASGSAVEEDEEAKAAAKAEQLERDTRKVFVGNLPFSTTDEELMEMFREVAEVEEVAMGRRRDPSRKQREENGRPAGFAFVTFVAPASVALAIAAKHGALIGDRPISVEAINRREPTPHVPRAPRVRQAPKLDAEGNPIPRAPRAPKLDAEGNPIPRPKRAKRARKLDEDGNPIPRPPRAPKLDEDGNPIPRPPRARKLDEDGNPIPRPPRAPKLDENGNVIPRRRSDKPRNGGAGAGAAGGEGDAHREAGPPRAPRAPRAAVDGGSASAHGQGHGQYHSPGQTHGHQGNGGTGPRTGAGPRRGAPSRGHHRRHDGMSRDERRARLEEQGVPVPLAAYIGGVPPGATAETLVDALTDAGFQVNRAHIMMSEFNVPRGFGFVYFVSDEERDRAVRDAVAVHGLRINEAEVSVKVAVMIPRAAPRNQPAPVVVAAQE